MISLTRDESRRLEVWAIMQPYQAVDWDALAEQAHAARKARKQREYMEMKMYDPASYRRMLEKQSEKRCASRKWRKLRPSERREMLRMHACGATARLIAKAFGVTPDTAVRVVAAQTGGTRRRGEKIRPACGAANANWKSTPELVAKVIEMSGSDRAVARALGVSHSLVARLRRKMEAA